MLHPISCIIGAAHHRFKYEMFDVAFLAQSNQSFYWSELVVKCLDLKSFILACQKPIFYP